MQKDSITIFLDIDGCLCTISDYGVSPPDFWEKEIGAKVTPYPFNKDCVDSFNDIIKDIDVDIIISSDWKRNFTLEQLRKIFNLNNVIKCPSNCTTSYIMFDRIKERSYEIKKFIIEHNINKYIVVDDINMKDHFNNFILCNDVYGLKDIKTKDEFINLINNLNNI